MLINDYPKKFSESTLFMFEDITLHLMNTELGLEDIIETLL